MKMLPPCFTDKQNIKQEEELVKEMGFINICFGKNEEKKEEKIRVVIWKIYYKLKIYLSKYLNNS